MRTTVADTASLQQAATKLLNARYGEAGYGVGRCILHKASHLPFVTMAGGEIVSTITLAVDGPEGLPIDDTFPDELAALRLEQGTSLCALTLFASSAGATKAHLAALFGEVFRIGSSRFGCTDLIIEVSPRHSRFYQVLLGFEAIATRFNTGVGSPAVLMRRSVRDIGASIAAQAGGTLFQTARR